jgi:dihydroorotate dehydrogenase
VSLYRGLLRPVLFRMGGGDAERAHERALWHLCRLARTPLLPAALHRMLAVPAPRTVFGLRFANPVGLAAGMDKDGLALRAWWALGFGFAEVGTVTFHPQPGNPQPRLFRLPASGALVNRMGFNNAGAEALARRLAATGEPRPYPVGISIGKSRVTPVEEAVADYVASLRALRRWGDYFAVNVSSPNTPGLRRLQDPGHLAELLSALRAEAESKPLLVKIAPDLTDQAVCQLLEVCEAHGVNGVIATNTTLSRDGVADADAQRAGEVGGLSGRPLAARAREVVALITRETGGRLPVVGVGGVLDPDDALRLVDAGAALVQLYTGLVYRGPGLVRDINRRLAGRAADPATRRSDRPVPDGPAALSGELPEAGEPPGAGEPVA